MADGQRDALNRRKFMKRAATTSAITLGVAATSTTSVAASVPVPSDRAESLLDAHADGVLSLLEADGVLADRSELPTEIVNDFGSLVEGNEGTSMLSVPEQAEELKVVKQVDDGTLTVTVQPESDHAFAILDTGDDKIAYNDENGRYDFGAMPLDCSCTSLTCSNHAYCYDECCSGGSCDYTCGCTC